LEQDEESKAEEEGEEAAADKIDCILNASGDAFDAWTAIESGDVLGAASGATSLAADWETCAGSAKGKKAGCCFAAGTPVHTDHGDVPVEKVEVGDEVFSRNRETGQLESQPVTALTPPHQDKLIEMRIEGERTPLRPSTSHPFWLKRGDALPAWMPPDRCAWKILYNRFKATGAGLCPSPRSKARKPSTTSPSIRTTITSSERLASWFITRTAIYAR